jgi:general secretion pathway protein G
MLGNRHLTRDGGFTLIELLIVVLILGILAGVVVPQFASSTQDARVASLDTTLVTMRGAIDLYFQQHGEYPSQNGDGVNLADTPAAFLTQLTQYTDVDGDVSLTIDATHTLGPYLKKPVMPLEPMTNSNALEIITVGALGMTANGTDPGGWRFDNPTGQFIVNDGAWETR